MKKTFPLRVVLSLTHRWIWCEFSKLHELAEFVAGHPVWTHEFASRVFVETLREAVFSQRRDLRHALPDDLPLDTSADRVAWFDSKYLDLCQKYGEEIELEQGTARRRESPIESAKRLMPNAEIISVNPHESDQRDF